MPTNVDERRPESFDREGVTVLNSRFLSLPMPLLDVLVGAIFMFVALLLWIGADYIDRSNTGLVGPAGFPRGVALIFGAVSLVMALRGAIELRSARSAAAVEFVQPFAVLAAMIMAVAYPFLLGSFNYYLVTGPWLVVLFFITGFRRPLPMLLCAVGFLVFAKLVFEMLMGIPLP